MYVLLVDTLNAGRPLVLRLCRPSALRYRDKMRRSSTQLGDIYKHLEVNSSIELPFEFLCRRRSCFNGLHVLRCAILVVILVAPISARPDQSRMDDEAHRELARRFQAVIEGTRRLVNLVREIRSKRSQPSVPVAGELPRQFGE